MILYYAFICFPQYITFILGKECVGEFILHWKPDLLLMASVCCLPACLQHVSHMVWQNQILGRSVLHSYQPTIETVFVKVLILWFEKKKILLSRVHFSVSCRKILTITYSSCRNTFFFQLIFFKLYFPVFQFWPNSAVLLQSVVTAYKVCEGRGRERAWRSMTSSFRKRRLEHFLLLPLCTIKRVNQE